MFSQKPNTTNGLVRLKSIKNAAMYLGLSPRTLYNGTVPSSKKPFPVQPIRIGGKPLFDVRDLDAYIDGLKAQNA